MAQNTTSASRPPWADPNATPIIRIAGVSKAFGGFRAVDHVDLDIHRGELFSLLGASGSGKTTLLRMLAGFEQPTGGRIFIDGVDMAEVPPYERPVNMVFQSYALFPHMTVAQNVAFGLKQDRMPRAQIRERVAHMLELVQLGKLGERRPHQLSGGQRQRVALARALVKAPKVLLLDEPLSALDKKLRERTQFELVNLQERLGITFVMVTHDQEEAMTMSSRVAVMRDGRIEQVGTPVEVYEYPTSRYVADFIGTANIFEGIVTEATAGETRVQGEVVGEMRIAQAAGLPPGAAVTVMVRPEKMAIARERPGTQYNAVAGVVRDIAYLGGVSVYHIALDGGRVVQASLTNLRHTAEQRITWEDRVWLSWHPANALVLVQ